MSARHPATTSAPAVQFGSPSQFFDLSDPGVADLFGECEYVWDSLKRLKEIVRTMVENTTVVRGTVMRVLMWRRHRYTSMKMRVSSPAHSSMGRVTSAQEL